MGTELVVRETTRGQERRWELSVVSMALTRKRTVWGSGALEVGDLRILEDGGECSGALVSDVVASDTASEGQDGTMRK